MTAKAYAPGDQEAWDDFIDSSCNGTFILKRPYLEYHHDRFQDSSLVWLSPKGEIEALLPAHAVNGQFVSHGGLTYGGLIIGDNIGQATMIGLLEDVMAYTAHTGLECLVYTPIPWIYHRRAVQSDLYGLHMLGATLSTRRVLSVVDLRSDGGVTPRRRRAIRKAAGSGCVAQASRDWAGFWNLLTRRLDRRHGVRPVHDLEEISLLAERFPDSIHLYETLLDGEQVAGVVLYLSDMVARVQYMAANETGRSIGALDFLLHWLISEELRDMRFLDLGSSHVPESGELNEGLIEYKEGFGARTVVHDTYRLDVGV